MTSKRNIEIFSAGCPVCEDAVSLVNQLACDSCEVTVLDMNRPDVSERAKKMGIRSVPAVTVDGHLAACCGAGLNEDILKQAGLGQPLDD